MNKEDFLKAAQQGAVTVVFEKINGGGKRIMPCTLNRELSNNNVPEVLEQNSESDHYAVWALDKEAWRSFRVDTVTEWHIGYPLEV